MFEAQVAYYLNKYLGKYLYGLDAESLKISVWKGDVELRNLALRPEALQDLDLPITVKAGLLGKLTLKVMHALLIWVDMFWHILHRGLDCATVPTSLVIAETPPWTAQKRPASWPIVICHHSETI